MPRRKILTGRQRAALFDLPTDEALLLHHYTLADDDLEIIRSRRRRHNRFGFALQLCAVFPPCLRMQHLLPLEAEQCGNYFLYHPCIQQVVPQAVLVR